MDYSDEMKATGAPGKQSRALQSCWRWSPLWRPTTKKMFWWRFFSTMQTGKRGKIKNLKKITALLKLHCKHGQAALTSEKKKSYASITSVLRLTCRGLQWISANRWTSRTPVEHLRRPTWLSSSWTAAPWDCSPGWSRSPGWPRSCTEAWPGCPRTTAFFGVCCSLETNEMKNHFKTSDLKFSPWVTSFCSSTMLSVEQNVEGTMKENNSCSVPFIKSSRIPWMLLPAS